MPPKIEIEYSSHFLKERKKYVKKNLSRFKDYDKVINLFSSNPKHPSLNIEKLKSDKSIYTIRLNKGDRIFFIWKKERRVLFIDIGKHDKYRKY